MTIQDTVIQAFEEKFGEAPTHIVRAPGRVNLIGEHTEYNDGFVLPMAINRAMWIALRPTNTPQVTIHSLDFDNPVDFSLSDYAKEPGTPADYVKGIAWALQEEGYTLRGWEGVMKGNVPIGAGLSSSAALCCGFIFSISELFSLNIPKTEIALLAKEAEHKVGLNCGLMDQFSVLFGKKDSALFFDCKDLLIQQIPIAMDGYIWVLSHSNSKHELAADSEYNDRRISCENVVQKVKQKNNTVNSLRDVDVAMLASVMGDISKTDYIRAKYILEENQRVLQMLDALRQNDAVQVGKILIAGHKGLSQEYGVSTPEMDFLVATATAQKNVLGARMIGGGFGGCTINLVKNENIHQTVTAILSNYKKETGIVANFYELKIGEGTAVV